MCFEIYGVSSVEIHMVLSDMLSFVGKSTLQSFLHRTHVAEFRSALTRAICEGPFARTHGVANICKNRERILLQISFPDKVFIN